MSGTAHHLSGSDRAFRVAFEAGTIAPADFGHRDHVRLAYAYLAENDVERSVDLMRDALHGFLRRHGIPQTKYHETMTRASILAVRHFMEKSPAAGSADEFIAGNALLLDSRIMLTHYSADLLFSEEARARFVEPDKDAIPRYDRR